MPTGPIRNTIAAALLAALAGMGACPTPAAGAGDAPASAADRYRARETDPAGAQALARVLADYYRRGDGEGGFAFWMSLGMTVRARQVDVPEVRHWRNLLELLRDANRRDAPSCAVSGQSVLHDPTLGCDFPRQLARYKACIAPLPATQRDRLLAAVATPGASACPASATP